MENTQAKNEFLDNLVKQCQENIWTLEIQLMDSSSKLAIKKAYADLIPKRMEEKFYPTAKDGRDDLKMTQDMIASFQMNVEKFQEAIRGEKDKIALIESYKNS